MSGTIKLGKTMSDTFANLREKFTIDYRLWWIGKMCKTATSGAEVPYKKVVNVHVTGLPNAARLNAALVFEDGTSVMIGHLGPRPEKKDVKVKVERKKTSGRKKSK